MSKRKHDIFSGIYKFTRANKPKLNNGLTPIIKDKPWISATKTFNYMINDPLVDWLKLYSKNTSYGLDIFNTNPNPRLGNSFVHFLRNKGIEFESKVIEHLRLNYTDLDVKTVNSYYSEDNIDKTIEYMKQGIPLIHSGSLKDEKSRTYGMPDIIIRSDYIPKIFGNSYYNQDLYESAPLLNKPYHYRIIDIKFSTLHLTSDGIHLLNSGKIAAYKTQLCIYNNALSSIQGYNSNKSYILGRRWNYKSCGHVMNGFSSFEKLGLVDFSNKDKDYIDRTELAIKWYRSVLMEGNKWTINPPCRPELYPNMCVDSYEWNKVKEKLAIDISEITMLWQCGPKNRNIAFNNGVTSWKDDNCTASALGVCQAYAGIVDSIIDINNGQELMSITNLPKGVIDDGDCDDFYVDFETLSDICQSFDSLTNQKEMNIIFMIGVGRYNKDTEEWDYKSFIADDISYESEIKIMNDFYLYINLFKKPRLFYWYAENGFWNKSLRRHNLQLQLDWVDLSKIFKKHNISIKNCFNFGLKNIAKVMLEHGMITTKLNSDCNNGMMAMVKAWECYSKTSVNTDIRNNPIMKDIGIYNEFDCKILFDIITYLRTKV